MKHFPAGIFVTALFAAMLIFPQAVFSGAEEGLLLWFQIIFPTLFPFLVVTSLLLSSGGLNLITRLFGGLFRRIFRVTQNGAFAVLAGFLCGYPMGAKVTADLLRAEKISDREARYLLSFCNNTSPVFIINFIVWKTFGDERLMLPTLLILIGSPVLMSFIFRRIYLKGRHPFPEPSAALKEKKTRFDFSVLDSCMMNSFEAIVKVGGYIILFSVLLSLLEELSGQKSILMTAAPALEVTNGILLLSSSVSDPGLRYAAVLGLTSFGGLCSAAQTQCMLEGTGLSVIPYIIQKLTTAAAASLLSFIYLALFSPFH
ncbi:MAG TPA: transporter [Candidatus Mediterraneibacter faecigallinarum]|uniref:Transporter n=1 Tax=Candidatus Mediterraneibacter faecigallinarum TaxID=2838669 RepID=A0A9D2NWA4_9FIRM|nr:transporter [Candidatus Mediterraneibacter faecigallinarum]